MKTYVYDKVTIAKKVKALRRRRGLHISNEGKENMPMGVADILNLGASAYNKREQGKTPFKVDELMELCNVMDCDIDYFLTDMTCTTHTANTVHDITGLSEEAINKLIGCDEIYDLAPRSFNESDEEFERFVSREKLRFINFISHMISHKDFLPIMYKMLTVSEDWKASRSLSARAMGLISDDAVKVLRMKSHRTSREDELLLALYDVETLTTDYIEQIIQDYSDSSEMK